MTQRIGFTQRFRNDYRASREFYAARKKLQTIAAQRQSAEKEFQSACHEIGAKAAELNLATDLPAGQTAMEQRRKVAEAQDMRHQRETALKSAEDALAADSEKYGRIIPELQAEHRSLADAAKSARNELDDIWRQVGGLESQIHADENTIADAAEGKLVSEPLDTVQQRMNESSESLRAAQTQVPEAHEKYVKAAAIAQAKAAELQQTQQTWTQLESQHKADVQSAKTAHDEAARAVEAATALLAAAEREFGREIFASSQRPAELEPSVSAAQTIAARMADLDAQRANLQSVMASTKPSARRFTTISVIAALVVIAIIVIIIVFATRAGRGKGESGGATGGAGGTPATAPALTQPTTAPVAPPTTAPAIPPATRPAGVE